ncbi:hypothetical protein AB6A40_005994 [Gnathostoma spinigerum]|uniref:N-acetyltransferase domain-containing protein n=1 Tax=Gnathostoma spinigerum TaxID=75299 RepID=A0ABD6EI82_9BILA
MSRILGILKVGRKQLFLYDKEMKAYRGDLLALLDFYVHFSCQRRGYGKVLFDFMLRNENAEPYEIALDNPSATLIGFLSKHYNLTDAIWQNTSFVVFNCLLESAKNKDTNVPEGWTRSSAPIEIITSKCKSGETSGIESKNEVHGDSERLIDGTMANRSSQARQRKAYILSSKPLW